MGILTGGGDCAGLNSAIKWVVYGAVDQYASGRAKSEIEVIAVREGWEGLLKLDPARGVDDKHYVTPLNDYLVRKIDRDGGTAIGTTRTNPFEVRDSQGNTVDESATVAGNIETLGLDGLIALGGEDTLGVANKLHTQYGIPVVGIPKTIDLDLPGTEYSLGFDTAVNNIKILIDHARTVAGSHQKTAVVEVMGRHSGFLAFQGGIVTSAHFTLIPEYPFRIGSLVEMIDERKKLNSRYTLVVVAEGATEEGGEIVARRQKVDAFGHVHLGGIGEILADQIEEKTGLDTFSEKLGYLQRGGNPTSFDVKMGCYFGISAVDLILRKQFGKMVGVCGGRVSEVPLTAIDGTTRTLDVDLLYDTDRLRASRKTSIGWNVL